MRKHEIENWVLQVVDQVKAGQPNEDSRVELKTEWIEPEKAAWQIAGHANAARGELILWLIGIDEKGQRVVGANNTELSSWYPAVESKFDDGMAPALVTDLNVPVEGKIVVALLFETDRAPFVIKNSEGGRITHAVPFRRSKGTWCAGRSELIRLLSPIQKLPEVEILGCKLDSKPTNYGGHRAVVVKYGSPWQLNLSLELYIIPHDGNKAIIPWHRCKCWIELPGIISPLTLELIRHKPRFPISSNSPSVKESDSEVIVNAPGKLILHAAASVSKKYPSSTENIEVNVSLGVIGTDAPILVKTLTSYPGFSEGKHSKLLL